LATGLGGLGPLGWRRKREAQAVTEEHGRAAGPKCPIVAISPIDAAGRKLSVVWGVHCVIDEDARDQTDMVERACRIAFKERFAAPGQRIIVVAGLPLGTPGATNFMRIAYVADENASR
jgi:pyruvate kinase